jgi:hypothetical protein
VHAVTALPGGCVRYPKLERVCSSQYRLHLESATSTGSRRDLDSGRVNGRSLVPSYTSGAEYRLQAGRAQSFRLLNDLRTVESRWY